MSFTTWMPPEVSSEAFDWKGQAWRIVEAQHIAATMKLVDNYDEQDLLETLLETSKPLMPEHTVGLHYLLATPFRYNPHRSGSRFRAVTDPGVFYGAQSVRTAGAELGYWRWKFLQDAMDLKHIEPVAHTAFQVDISTTVVDLQRPPFDVDALVWQHSTEYGPTQQFARTAREAKVGGILYRSVRDVEPSWCIALLNPLGFSSPKLYGQTQTWFLAVYPHEVTLRSEFGSMRFSSKDWGQIALQYKLTL